ncbi:MAG: type II secretion system F family protein [bacterium]
MPIFTYKAYNDIGAPVTGTIEASSTSVVAMELDKMGLIPIAISEKSSFDFNKLNYIFSRIKIDDIIFFTRQLRAIIKAGVPLLKGLKSIEEQIEDNKLKYIISTVSKDIDQGKTFSAALAKHPRTFSEVYISTIDAGEKGGVLDDVLERLIKALEFNRKTMSMIKTALRYPTIVMFVICGAFIFLVNGIFPKFMSLFQGAKVKLPLPTRIMMAINYYMQNYWLYIVPGIALLIAAFLFYTQTEQGRINWDYFKIKIPIIGPVLLKIYMARFSNTLEILIRSGLPIDLALPVVARSIGNAYIAVKVRESLERITKGSGIARSLKETGIFTSLVVQMVSTGEETGELDNMLLEVTDYYEKEVDYAVSKLSSYLEPILLLGLVSMVATMALAVFLPMWDMMRVMKGGG